MFKRAFGRSKDSFDLTACAACGRTLLAGEQTQSILEEDGTERRICMLCARPETLSLGDDAGQNATIKSTRRIYRSVAEEPSPQSNEDALRRALAEKEDEIERVNAQLTRLEAERRDLLDRLSHVPAIAQEPEEEGDEMSLEELERTLAGKEPLLTTPQPAESAQESSAPAIAFEDTQPISLAALEALQEEAATIAEELSADEMLSAEQKASAPSHDRDAAEAPALELEEEPATNEFNEAELAEEEASFTLLQRGVDLLNVSSVPRRIVETSEQLGTPTLNITYTGEALTATFMWSIGWYRFQVDTESGDIELQDRGYDELTLPPNAGVREDGTIQLTAGRLNRPSATRRPPATPTATTPEPPSVATQKAPEILSKSLLGQRSDDQPATWEQAQARDFDWTR